MARAIKQRGSPKPDVDQIEALSGEREALWARVDAKHRHSDACEHRSAMTRR
jgi:hypothetical protein